jgi:hypothetical protein
MKIIDSTEDILKIGWYPDKITDMDMHGLFIEQNRRNLLCAVWSC